MSAEASPKLRVLVISLGRIGGVTKYGQLMAAGLSRSCDVAAVTSTGADNRTAWQEFAGPRLEVDTFSSVLGMFASFFALPRFVRIVRFAREFRPDVIYYPGGHAYKPVLGVLLRRTPVVLTVHDPELHPGGESLAQRLFARANLLGCAGYVLLNQTQAAGFIERHHLAPRRVRVIPLGIFDDAGREQIPLGQIPGAEAIASRRGEYVLFIGRIERYKGIATLLKAWSRLDDAGRPPLVIAGRGTFTEEEQSLIGSLGDRVVVINRWLSEAEVSSLVAAARFVVVPYAQATQSAVIPLAFAHGVPAIASDAGGLAEQVDDGETGLLFHAGDATALADTLRRAISVSAADRDALGERARAYANANWSWDVLGARLAEFLVTFTRP